MSLLRVLEESKSLQFLLVDYILPRILTCPTIAFFEAEMLSYPAFAAIEGIGLVRYSNDVRRSRLDHSP